MDTNEALYQLRAMRRASLFEGCTLLALVGIAMPLKHVAGYAGATSAMGLIHGAAVLFYLWTLSQTIGFGGWSRRECIFFVLVAFLPFGAFLAERKVTNRERSLKGIR
ncbi:DUF3817 domain-containing protein [Rhizobium mesoamericanum]|uniref:DUF3817 domain-containing protein n=1 Tax=Rhizobium mesoamericanum TaxID=1079800 RepID=UPI00055CD9F0|nr:DUF3817 domain-containing protein [Rhizobium mesoamericanum]